MTYKSLIAAAAMASTLALSSAAYAQTTVPGLGQTARVRGEKGSARNLMHVRRKLETLIDEMQRDQHDYNGSRVKAIQDLQNARTDIDAALQYDRSHPGQ